MTFLGATSCRDYVAFLKIYMTTGHFINFCLIRPYATTSGHQINSFSNFLINSSALDLHCCYLDAFKDFVVNLWGISQPYHYN